MVKEENFILLSVPIKYKQIYDELLIRMANLGIDLLQECKSSCKGENQHLITCWNMFNAACAAYAKDPNNKLIGVLIKYIVSQLGIDFKEEDDIKTKIIIGNIDIDYENIIYFKDHLVDNIEDVLEMSDAEYRYLLTNLDEYQEMQQTKSVHFIMIPSKYIKLVKSSYGEEVFETILYDSEELINEYQIETVNYNDEDYIMYWSYSPYGKIDEKIKLILKIK